jgi:amino acid transporter
MLWSFSRDGGVPLYKVWAALNMFTGTPVNAVWAMASLAFLLGLPMLWSFTVFQAVTSISSVALYTSCEDPLVPLASASGMQAQRHAIALRCRLPCANTSLLLAS